MSTKYILSFDLGTGGNKAVLYDSDGTLLETAFVPYETYYPQSGWAEQRPADWWDSIAVSTRQVVKNAGTPPDSIACISISGHGIGVIPVDAKGNLLRVQTLLWSDSRALEQAETYFTRVPHDDWYSITGAALRPENYAIFKIMWHRDCEKELYDKTYKFIGTKDYINLKLTGEIVSDYSDASFSGVNDLQTWDYSAELLEASGIPREKLPDLVESTRVIGGLMPEPAEELGLVKGIPIVCGGYDGSCTALGAGNFKENRVYNYVGSSSWISAAADKPLINQEIKPYCYHHVVPNMYNSTVSIYSAGGSFQWFRNVLGRDEVFAGEIANMDPYSILEKEAEKSPVGANNVLFNPSLMGGATIHPSPHIHGAFVGLQLSHSKADLIRAVLEGVAMDLRIVLDCFRSMGITADEIRIVGGGSKGPLWRQIFSDVYNAEIVLTTVGQEAAALGAAVLAAVGTGIWKDFSMVDSIAKTVEVSKPIKAHTELYSQRLPLFRFVTEKLLDIGKMELEINKE